ncbi:MAG TPA: hypothetical protein VMC10_07680 [Stellaceae bacterium]|nr:hypothetical protein [Stellaceae bacterium]
MGVSLLFSAKSLRRVIGAALLLVQALGALPAAADGRSDSPYWNPSWRPPYPPPAPYGYDPPPVPRHRYPPPALACDHSNAIAGAFIGAAAGGLIASQATRGRHDNTGATIFGIFAGAMLGGAIGQSADEANCR